MSKIDPILFLFSGSVFVGAMEEERRDILALEIPGFWRGKARKMK